MLKSKVHFWTLQILFVLLIIFVATKVSFVFQPFIVFISTLFFPMLIAGILYFIFNPVVRLLEKKNSADIIHSIDLFTVYRFACLYFSVSRTYHHLTGDRAV